MTKTLAGLGFMAAIIAAIVLILSGCGALASTDITLAQVMSTDKAPQDTASYIYTDIRREGEMAEVGMVVIYRETYSDPVNAVAAAPHDFNTFALVVDCTTSTVQMKDFQMHTMNGGVVEPMILTPIDSVVRGPLYEAACLKDFTSYHPAESFTSTTTAAQLIRARLKLQQEG